MSQYVSWLANAALFTICCFLVADTANAVFAAVLAPPPAVSAATAPAAPPRARRGTQVILARNLFQASLLAPTGPVVEAPPEENLEATKLPLTLLGTAANSDAANSWAAIQDQQKRENLILKAGDELQRGVTLVRVEARRVVLSENGTHRELALDDEDGAAPRPPARTARARPPRRTPPRRAPGVKKTGDDRFSVAKSDVEEMVRNPATLFSQARILPKYDEGEMVGLQVNAIKSGSLFEEIGLQNGDVITELNGISIDSPEESAKILAEFAEAKQFSVVVESGDEIRELDFEMPEGE